MHFKTSKEIHFMIPHITSSHIWIYSIHQPAKQEKEVLPSDEKQCQQRQRGWKSKGVLLGSASICGLENKNNPKNRRNTFEFLFLYLQT